MGKLSFVIVYIILVVLQLIQRNAGAEVSLTRFERLVEYDGLSCLQTDTVYLRTDVLQEFECMTLCYDLAHCACVFYKQGYCQGCMGLCHHGATLPALPGSRYYYTNKTISSVKGGFNFGTKYYLASRYMATWQNAMTFCNSLEATLFYTETQEELNFIAAQLDQHYYWSGGIFTSGQFVWSHSGAPINMTLFAYGQPDTNATCVGMWKPYNYDLDDHGCSRLAHFICKSF